MYIYQDHVLLNTSHHVHPWDDQGHGESIAPKKCWTSGGGLCPGLNNVIRELVAWWGVEV
jgi:hypothetical protein